MAGVRPPSRTDAEHAGCMGAAGIVKFGRPERPSRDGVGTMDFATRDEVAMSQHDMGFAPDADSATLERQESRPAMTMDKASGAADARLVETLAAETTITAMAAVAAAAQNDDSKAIRARRFAVQTDASRDALLTEFGKDTLDDRYLLPGETYQDLFARVADAYADDHD